MPVRTPVSGKLGNGRAERAASVSDGCRAPSDRPRHPLLRQLKGSVKVERGCDQGLRGLVEHVGHGAAEKSRYSGVLACEDFEGRYRLEVLLDVVLPHLRKEVTTRRKDAT